ncbi:hypothetical protein C7N43_27240 [Sphingobacteriales bacterium UPWRP_1]|nr:hypothetical protein C7N43_27240 [Sphingobacteriales bacterium UPWRP_1]
MKSIIIFLITFFLLAEGLIAQRNSDVSEKLKTISQIKTICEETAKDIKSNWKSKPEAVQIARFKYITVKSEYDAWLEQVILSAQLNESPKKTIHKASLEKVVRVQEDFIKYYLQQAHPNNSQVVRSPLTIAVVGEIFDAFLSIFQKVKNQKHQDQKDILKSFEELKLLAWDDIRDASNQQTVDNNATIIPNNDNANNGNRGNTNSDNANNGNRGNTNSDNANNNNGNRGNTNSDNANNNNGNRGNTNSDNANNNNGNRSNANSDNTNNSASKPCVDYSNLVSEIYDQGQLKTAVGYALAMAFECQLSRQDKNNVKLSPEHLFYSININKNNVKTGEYLFDGLEYIKNTGIISKSDWLAASKDRVGAPPDLSNLKHYRIKDYELLYRQNYDSPVECESILKSGLKSFGPLVIDIALFDTSFYSDNSGIISEPATQNYYLQQALVLVGYDDDKKMFKVVNSKGNQWGDGGYGYVSYQYAATYIRYAYALIYGEKGGWGEGKR